ncbi:hypothetical protein CDL15_Pgr004030 [Punica granatum]|uniref:Uncharacterized protein n=1 Tax=Punica granatum TaxID=22663 RepID=A0A218XGK8_PUNGR|nr:hypothetical protein CDL15_Pgr004030 [Punica granatum]
MSPIIRFIQSGILPSDSKEAKRIRAHAPKYTILDGILYKRGYTLQLLRCVDDEDTNYVLREIHQGIIGAHEEAKSLVLKVLQQDYY